MVAVARHDSIRRVHLAPRRHLIATNRTCHDVFTAMPRKPASGPARVRGPSALPRAAPLSVTPHKNGSAFELGKSKADDAAILHDPVEIVAGTVTWRPERAETAFAVHIPLPVRAPFVLDVCGATTGFEGLSGTVAIGKTSCCQGGCDVLCPHGIAVSNSKVLERLDHFLLRGWVP